MKPLENNSVNDQKLNIQPQTIEQKLDEAIHDLEAGITYSEEEVWRDLSEKYGLIYKIGYTRAAQRDLQMDGPFLLECC